MSTDSSKVFENNSNNTQSDRSPVSPQTSMNGDNHDNLEIEQTRGHLGSALASTIYTFIGSLSSTTKKGSKDEMIGKEPIDQGVEISAPSRESFDKPLTLPLNENIEREDQLMQGGEQREMNNPESMVFNVEEKSKAIENDQLQHDDSASDDKKSNTGTADEVKPEGTEAEKVSVEENGSTNDKGGSPTFKGILETISQTVEGQLGEQDKQESSDSNEMDSEGVKKKVQGRNVKNLSKQGSYAQRSEHARKIETVGKSGTKDQKENSVPKYNKPGTEPKSNSMTDSTVFSNNKKQQSTTKEIHSIKKIDSTRSPSIPLQRGDSMTKSQTGNKKRKAEEIASGRTTELKQIKKNNFGSEKDKERVHIFHEKNSDKTHEDMSKSANRGKTTEGGKYYCRTYKENDPHVGKKVLSKTCVFCNGSMEAKTDTKLLSCLHKAHIKCYEAMNKKKNSECPSCNSNSALGDKFKQITASAGNKNPDKKLIF